MIIEYIKWREVMARHISSKKEFAGKTDHLPEAYITLADNRLDIQEITSWTDRRSWLYANPKLIKLTKDEIEIEAEWWGTHFPTKGPAVNLPNHKVIITAKF